MIKPFSEVSEWAVGGGGSDASAMGKKSCGQQCCLSLLSTACQCCVAILFIVLCFYLASLALTPVRIVGITQLPPGIVYAHHDGRF